MIIDNQWVKRKIEISWDKWKYKHQNLWNTAKPDLRNKFIIVNTYIKKKKHARDVSNKQPNIIPQGIRKKWQTKPKVSRKKEKTKIKVEKKLKRLKKQ